MSDRGGRRDGGRFVGTALSATLLACGGAEGSDLLQHPPEPESGVTSPGDASRDAPPPACSDATTGGGSCVRCMADADCPATGNECVVATCVANACGTVDLDASHVLSTGQTAGDCQEKVCDGMGGTTSIADDGDRPAAGVCRVGSCVNGVPSSGNAANGAPCDDGNACTADDACSSGVCAGTGCASGICGNSLSAFTGTTPTLDWSLDGAAAYDATSNSVVLVDGTEGNSVGAAIYDNPVTMDTFRVSFDFRITDIGNGRADGMMFVIETNGKVVMGGNGGGLGALGLDGYGVELDIFDNATCTDSDQNHAGVDVLTPMCPTNEGLVDSIAVSANLLNVVVGDVGDAMWRTVTVALTAGQMSVAVTGPASDGPIAIPNLQSVALPGFVSGTPYYFGFTAATGGYASRHEVRNVQIAFATDRCL